MSTKTIYLIRHAQASFGAKNYDQISDLGKTQSTLLATALQGKNLNPDAVICGTLKRHQQTGSIAWPNTKPLLMSGWNEFDHESIFKDLMNTRSLERSDVHAMSERETLTFFSDALNHWISQGSDMTTATESWPSFSMRIQKALKETIELTKKTSVVFTSGGPIATVIAQHLDLDTEQTMKINWHLVNTGITKIIASSKGYSVSSTNEHAHLECAPNKTIITYK